MLKVIDYIREYGLNKTVEDFKLKMREYDNKVLIKYSQIESNMGLEEVQDSRGLILEKDTWNIMCLPFRKFFNNSEGHAANIDWDSALILDKLDGSLLTLYWDWNKEMWFGATTGTAEGEGVVNNKLELTFNDLFMKTIKVEYDLNVNELNKGYNYVFELTTPYNIVVKPHNRCSATLLTIRNVKTLKEVSREVLVDFGKMLGLPVVKVYDMNIKNVGTLIKTFKNMPWTEEGYVVVDSNFNRVKIKNPAYVAVHHLKSKTSEHAIMGVVKTNEIDEFGTTFPDRKEEIEKLKRNYDKLTDKLSNAWGEIKTHLPKNITKGEQKQFALRVFEISDKYNVKMFNGLFFNLKDGKVNSINEFLLNYDNKKLYNIL